MSFNENYIAVISITVRTLFGGFPEDYLYFIIKYRTQERNKNDIHL